MIFCYGQVHEFDVLFVCLFVCCLFVIVIVFCCAATTAAAFVVFVVDHDYGDDNSDDNDNDGDARNRKFVSYNKISDFSCFCYVCSVF
jgi:hypothetical protein